MPLQTLTAELLAGAGKEGKCPSNSPMGLCLRDRYREVTRNSSMGQAHCFLEAGRLAHVAVSCHLLVPVPQTQPHGAVTGIFSFFAIPSRQFSSESLHWHSGAEFPLYNLGLSVTHSTPPPHSHKKAAGCPTRFHPWARTLETLPFPQIPT